MHPTYKFSPPQCSSFFDVASYRHRPITSPTTPLPAPIPQNRRRIQKLPVGLPMEKPQTKEWWEVPVATRRWRDIGPRSFEFDLPEHLPNSPMCPANKKHKSGGTGVCVYHGRRRRSSEAVLGVADSGNMSGNGTKLEGVLGRAKLTGSNSKDRMGVQ
jgi:hypothetical protein